MERIDKPELRLVGEDGNAFAILGRAGTAARQAGWTRGEIDVYINEATAGDYNHLLCTTMEYFDCDRDEE